MWEVEEAGKLAFFFSLAALKINSRLVQTATTKHSHTNTHRGHMHKKNKEEKDRNPYTHCTFTDYNA